MPCAADSRPGRRDCQSWIRGDRIAARLRRGRDREVRVAEELVRQRGERDRSQQQDDERRDHEAHVGRAVENSTAERHALHDVAVVADFGSLAYDHAHPVIDEEAATDPRTRMNLDTGQQARNSNRLTPSRRDATDAARALMHGIFVGEIQALEGAGRTCFDFETGELFALREGGQVSRGRRCVEAPDPRTKTA